MINGLDVEATCSTDRDINRLILNLQYIDCEVEIKGSMCHKDNFHISHSRGIHLCMRGRPRAFLFGLSLPEDSLSRRRVLLITQPLCEWECTQYFGM